MKIARVVIVLLFGAALLLGIARRGFDYDEIEHAHSTWLVAGGERPFHDFFECHPPFVWYAYAPAAWVFENPLALLLALRVLAAAGNVAFLALLIANMRREGSFVAVAFVACATSTLQYLLELRIDSWPAAGLLAAFLLVDKKTFLRYCGFSAIALLCALASPKIAALAAFLWIGVLIRDRRESLAGLAAGVGVGASIAALFFVVTGIDPLLAYTLTISFHARFAEGATFPIGLARALLEQPLLLVLCTAGVIAWAVNIRKATVFEISVLLYLLLQLATVPFPYKQYTAPFFLLAATFLPALFRYSKWLQWIFVAFIAIQAGSSAMEFAQDEGVARQRAYFDALRIPADARVVAPVPLHPVTRKDAMYGWLRSLDAGGDYETEAVMADLKVPRVSERFTVAHYLRELEANKPDLVIDEQLAPLQTRAVKVWCAQRRTRTECRP